MCVHTYWTYRSKKDWYNGVGELFGLCLKGLWVKLPRKQTFNVHCQNRHLMQHTLKIHFAFNSGLHLHTRIKEIWQYHYFYHFDFFSLPDFESESVEYLLSSALPSLKSESGPLFPVNQVRNERWQQCLIPVHPCAPRRHYHVWTEPRPAHYTVSDYWLS